MYYDRMVNRQPKKKAAAKKSKREPSLRTKVALKKMVENGGSLSGAMRDAGFSDAYAKNPQKLSRAKTVLDYLNKILPPETVANEYPKLLNIHRLDSFIVSKNITSEEIEDLKQALKDAQCVFRSIQETQKGTFCYYYVPDGVAKSRALDMIHKLRGDYSPEKIEDVSPFRHLSDAELAQRVQQRKKFFTKKD